MASFTNQATLSYKNITVSSNIVTGEIAEVLSAVKTAVSGSYSAGETLTYAVSLVNSGTVPLTDVTITDDLGGYDFGTTTLVPLTYVDGSVQYFADGVLRPAPAATGGTTLVISGITVPAGGDAVIIYQAAVNEFAPLDAGSEITNTVTVDGTGAPSVTASATVPAANEALLSINKALSPAEVAENEQITYTFLIQNTGNTAESGAVIGDTFTPVLKSITVGIGGAAAQTTDFIYSETTGAFETNTGAFTVPAAQFTQDPVTGAYTVIPGTATVTVTGTI